jgi:hypothetical protein
MSIFSKRNAVCRTLNPGMRSLLVKRQKVPIFQGIISADGETFLRKLEKASYQRNEHSNGRN